MGIKNTNAEEVIKAEREKREKDKVESQRKKEKDKEDRYVLQIGYNSCKPLGESTGNV